MKYSPNLGGVQKENKVKTMRPTESQRNPYPQFRKPTKSMLRNDTQTCKVLDMLSIQRVCHRTFLHCALCTGLAELPSPFKKVIDSKEPKL